MTWLAQLAPSVHAGGMELGIILAVVAALAIVAAIVAKAAPGRIGRDETQQLAWMLYEQVADEVPGLRVVRTESGWPRLEGTVDGVEVEIDHQNDVAYGLESLLGMRCAVPGAALAPNAAIWIGDVATLHGQFGRPRPVGDSDLIFDVYTRADPSASDWWQEPELHETLRSLPGAGILLFEGQLTVIFADLDAESVRTAMRIPSLIRQGVERVTIH